MKRSTLFAALIAAGVGFGAAHAQQQTDSSMPDPADASMGAADAPRDKAYDDRINIEGPEERLHGQRDGDMEGQPENLRADQLERAPAGDAASQSTAEGDQPQIPDQSLGSVGHPAQADTTGQGSGLDEQPATAEGDDMTKGSESSPQRQQ